MATDAKGNIVSPQIKGERVCSLKRDDDGHRTYTVKTLVAAATWDGPATVMQTPGIFVPGAFWQLALPGAPTIYMVGQIYIPGPPGTGVGTAPKTGLGYHPGDVLQIVGGTLAPDYNYPATC